MRQQLVDCVPRHLIVYGDDYDVPLYMLLPCSMPVIAVQRTFCGLVYG